MRLRYAPVGGGAALETLVTYSLALRPSAPALRRPQRLILKVEGEQVADVEYRPDHADLAPFARLERMSYSELAEAALGCCPSCGIAHALALCQAIEALAAVQLPPRAAYLRLAAAELERAASHLTTLAALFGALALPYLAEACAAQASATRTVLTRLAGSAPAAWIVPAGLARDITPGDVTVLWSAATILERLFPLAEHTIARRSLLARTVEIGVISAGAAEQFGLAGPLARAAGLTADLRRDAPYAAYADLTPGLVTQEGGDVHARMVVLLLEALEALRLVERVARALPDGPVGASLPDELPAGSASAAVEAPRGPLRYDVASDGRRLSAVNVRCAPQLDRLLARTVLANAALDDAALIVVSTDPCDACLAVSSDQLA